MKKMMILAIAMLSGTTLMAQTVTNDADKTDSSVAKEYVSKEQRHQEAVDALNRQDFVLQAHCVASTKNEDVAKVNSIANFLAVKGDKGLLQIAPPVDREDSPPLGVLTMQMDILSCNVKTDKRGNVTCQLSAAIDGVQKQFEIKLNKKTNKAVAEYEGSAFAFLGELIPGETANIHVGENKG